MDANITGEARQVEERGERARIDKLELDDLKLLKERMGATFTNIAQTERQLRAIDVEKAKQAAQKEALLEQADDNDREYAALVTRLMRKYGFPQGSNIGLDSGEIYLPGEPVP